MYMKSTGELDDKLTVQLNDFAYKTKG